MTKQTRTQAIQKLAQAAVPASYTVLAGDTLSGIAKRYRLKTDDLQAYNQLSDPNRLKSGQVLHLTKPTKPTIPSKPQQTLPAQVGLQAVSQELHKQFNNPKLEAAILANINRETGGTFDYRTWAGFKKQTFDPAKKQTGDYGLFQFVGPSQTDYKKWLTSKKLQDSMANQIGFMKNVYGPSRLGWKKNTAANSKLTREQLADWWHNRVETPAHVLKGTKYYNPTRIQQATQQHNDFMNKLRSGASGWTV